MSTTTNTCANCGKGEEGGDALKACTACMLVKYCNRDCQIAHRPQHKRACKKRAAELHDEQLFKEPPPPEDCPICMLILSLDADEVKFKTCCGKSICDGCIYAMRETGDKNMKLCPFCKTPPAISEEDEIKRTNKLVEKGNAYAHYALGSWYYHGIRGLPQDWEKANELWLKAGMLGCADAYYSLGNAYRLGSGGEIDKKKAKHYYELTAMNGHVLARHNLGAIEVHAGNIQRGCKQFILSASAGYEPSLDMVTVGYKRGYVTEDQYANTLREYQKSHDEMKSDARDKARAARNNG